MLTAVAVFSLMDASLKQLTSSYPPSQVSCIRGLASIPVMLLAVGWLAASGVDCCRCAGGLTWLAVRSP